MNISLEESLKVFKKLVLPLADQILSKIQSVEMAKVKKNAPIFVTSIGLARRGVEEF